jgi:hypothetical protein
VQGDIRSGIDDVVKYLKYIGYLFHLSFSIGNSVIAGKEDLSLNVREGFGENGDRHRLLVFACDSCKGLVLLLAYTSIKAFGLGEIFSRVSPDVQGFLWAWGSRCSNTWGGRWGSRGGVVSRLAMWFVVGYIGELLAYFLEFGGNTG